MSTTFKNVKKQSTRTIKAAWFIFLKKSIDFNVFVFENEYKLWSSSVDPTMIMIRLSSNVDTSGSKNLKRNELYGPYTKPVSIIIK